MFIVKSLSPFIYQEHFTNNKGVTRSHKSKDRQQNGQTKGDRKATNYLQNTIKLKIEQRTPLKSR